ncbi:MAG: SpoVR family protein [Bacteriovoracaceae bacterium]
MFTYRSRPIEGELLRLKERIEKYAIDYGLDFYPVIFEVCDYDTINILAAQEGFPNRYPHWRFGMQYDQMAKGYAYGMQKIYEMVINTDPCYAYLLNANHLVDQKTVMAHVYGHADFFKHNYWFSSTDRSMMDVMANHGAKIRRYMSKYGQDKVEAFIDKVNSIDNLIDPQLLFETPDLERNRKEMEVQATAEGTETDISSGSNALQSFLRSQKRLRDQQSDSDIPLEEDFKLPKEVISPMHRRDIMKFLMDFAPLKEWEADIIGILREEAYYFLPQRMTKIMNEGWASYWHSTIMTQKALKANEIIDFADHHAGVMAMSRKQINPYKIGIELMRDIEYRWNTGRFGKDYVECQDMNQKENWDLGSGLGREKIFEVRRTHNDITFIDEFFTEEFCNRMQIFTYKYNPRTGRNEVETRDFQSIKQKLLTQLTNFGTPLIEVEDANHKNRGELLLNHVHYGTDLDLNTAHDTLVNIYSIWRRPVSIATTVEGNSTVYCFDGKDFKPVK